MAEVKKAWANRERTKGERRTPLPRRQEATWKMTDTPEKEMSRLITTKGRSPLSPAGGHTAAGHFQQAAQQGFKKVGVRKGGGGDFGQQADDSAQDPAGAQKGQYPGEGGDEGAQAEHPGSGPADRLHKGGGEGKTHPTGLAPEIFARRETTPQ